MAEPTIPPAPPGASASRRRLDSWKEIAAYLGRSSRTVQRWEKEEGLPVHRLPHEKLASVYAYQEELDAWWTERGARLAVSADASFPASEAEGEPSASARVRVQLRARVVVPLVVLAALAGAAVWTQRWWRHSQPGAPATTRPLRLVVLPFVNLTGAADQEYLSDGLTEELITELGRLPELGVIARTSAMTYKGSPKGAAAIGRELNADYVLEGSVRRSGERFRVTAQLIRVSDDTHAWAESFDRGGGDLLALQSAVSRRLAEEIRLRLPPPAPERDVDADAYLAYLKGRYHWNQRTKEGFERATALFEEAVRLEPGFGRAHAGRADAYLLMSNYGLMPVATAMPRAREAALRALALDDSLAEGHASLGFILRSYDWDFTGAEREFRRALALNPNYATAHGWYGLALMHLGRFEEARAEFRRGLEADPLSATLANNLVSCDFYERRYAGVIDAGLATLERQPDDAYTLLELGRAYTQAGRHAEALATLEQARRLSSDQPMILAVLGYAQAAAGRKAEAERILAALERRARGERVPPYYLAIVAAGLGDHDRASEWLEQVYAERHVGILSLKVEPEFDGLRSDPRFQDLLRRAGLS